MIQMEFQLIIQFKIAITAIFQIIGNLNYASVRIMRTLFKFEACLYNDMGAFEFFKLKIKKFPKA